MNVKKPEIETIREYLGYTQADFAIVLGVRPTSYRRWITTGASARPVSPSAIRLARVVDCIAREHGRTTARIYLESANNGGDDGTD